MEQKCAMNMARKKLILVVVAFVVTSLVVFGDFLSEIILQRQKPVTTVEVRKAVTTVEVLQPVAEVKVQKPVTAVEAQQPVVVEKQQPIAAVEVQKPVASAELQQPVAAVATQQPVAEVKVPFEKFNTLNGKTKSVQMVCFTNTNVDDQSGEIFGSWHIGNRIFTFPPRNCISNQKKITVYQSLSEPKGTSGQFLGFNVQFAPISLLPKTHKIIENETAYFIGNKNDFEPENFFHFTKQIYFPLYWLVKKTNQLHHGARNIVFYEGVYGICPGVRKYIYHNLDRFFYFLQILNVKNKLELSAFTDREEPINVCYRNAVFSSELFLEQAPQAIQYFKDKIGVRGDTCPPNILVIMKRSRYRRILNIEELKKVGEHLGYDVRIVAMETMTMKEQAQLIQCTRILAGVTGAGLQWSFWMKDHSGVVEIAWPQKQWPFFFSGTGGFRKFKRSDSKERGVIRPLNFAQVSKVTCHMNPKAVNIYYEGLTYTKGNFTDEEARLILQDKRNLNFRNLPPNIGKLYDVTVDPEAFRAAVVTAGRTKK